MKTKTRRRAGREPGLLDVLKEVQPCLRSQAFRQGGRAVLASLLQEPFDHVRMEPIAPDEEVLEGLPLPNGGFGSDFTAEAFGASLRKLQNALMIYQAGNRAEQLFERHKLLSDSLIWLEGRYHDFPLAMAHYLQTARQTHQILDHRSAQAAIAIVAAVLLKVGKASRSSVDDIVRWSTRKFGIRRRSLEYRPFDPPQSLMMLRAARLSLPWPSHSEQVKRAKKAGRRPRR